MKAGKMFSAEILLAPKAPNQKFGCQPQILEGEEEVPGGGTPLLLRCTAVLMHHWGAGYGALEPKSLRQKWPK